MGDGPADLARSTAEGVGGFLGGRHNLKDYSVLAESLAELCSRRCHFRF